MAAEDRASGRLRVGGWIQDGDPGHTRRPASGIDPAVAQGRRAAGSGPGGPGGGAFEPAPRRDGAAHGPGAGGQAPRPGPGAPAATPWPDGDDGWARQPDIGSAAPHEAAVSQHGRRRLDRPAARGARPAVLAVAVAVLVAAVAGALWAVSAGDPDPQADGGETVTAEGAAGATPETPAATGSPGAVLTPSPAASSAAPSPSPRVTAAAFGPVAYEAEAPGNTLLGYAEVVALAGASGGRAVRHLGDGAGAKKDGALRFNAITVPQAGTYTLTFYYAQVAGPRAERVTISVAGGATVTAAVGGDGGCCASRSVSVRLRAGANAVTFTNTGGPAPAIDRVVVRRS